jgi:hypothetical protein
MPYQHFNDGLYLVRQKSAAKGVDHYGILDVGNRIGHPKIIFPVQPVVIHQRPPRIQIDWLQNTGEWALLGQITDEADAIARMRKTAENPNYDLFGHNCEHFARYVATGKRESTQIQVAVAIAGLVALAFVR